MLPVIRSTSLILAALAITTVLAGCVHPIAPDAASPTSSGSAASNGLIKAVHSECDFGDQILKYLATGDNQGNPQLDTVLADYVGVPLPKARGIANQKIQDCDAKLTKQRQAVVEESAAAVAQENRASAAAEESAQAVQDRAALLVIEQDACTAALGGTVSDKGGGQRDFCVSASRGSTNDGSNTSCAFALIAFQPDGTLLKEDVTGVQHAYPGCF